MSISKNNSFNFGLQKGTYKKPSLANNKLHCYPVTSDETRVNRSHFTASIPFFLSPCTKYQVISCSSPCSI
uniref:Uncharacterized protein n=1 Tax=Arundo donax TaxID=35708 RepID=A0A0A8XRW7_ARUDO